MFIMNIILIKSQALPTFNPSPFPPTDCNNLSGNYNSSWKPSHGSPSIIDLGCGNKVARLYAKNENISTRKSEGLFIDLNSIGITLNTSKKYKIIVSYRYSLPNNPNRSVNFDVYFANGLTEKSINDCSEEKEPTVSDKLKILTFNNGEFLDDTYTCQIKSKQQGQIAPSKSYKYLWIVSNMNTSLNSREYVDIDKIELYFDGNDGGTTTPTTCNLPKPSDLLVSDISYTSAKITWSPVNIANGYDIVLKDLSNNTFVNENFYHYTQKIYNDLKPNTSYSFTISSACYNNYDNPNKETYFFTTTCPEKVNNISVVDLSGSYKINFSNAPNISNYTLEFVDNINGSSGVTNFSYENGGYIYYLTDPAHNFKFRIYNGCYWSEWVNVTATYNHPPVIAPLCTGNNYPSNLQYSAACGGLSTCTCNYGKFKFNAVSNASLYEVEYTIFNYSPSSTNYNATFTSTYNDTYWTVGSGIPCNATYPLYIKFRVRSQCSDGSWSNFSPWSSTYNY